jgi:hypothetical protein
MFKLMCRYFWWTEARGSLHYDVMVTAILVFIFVTPHFINYKDRPVTASAAHASEVIVREAGREGSSSRFIYQIRTEDMHQAKTDDELRREILEAVEPISGEVTLERYEPVKDANGHIIAYDAWVLR